MGNLNEVHNQNLHNIPMKKVMPGRRYHRHIESFTMFTYVHKMTQAEKYIIYALTNKWKVRGITKTHYGNDDFI